MIKPIVIKVTDKVPELVSGPEYVVCDNSDYTVVWQLDEEWAQFEHRTMQVNYKDGTYERVLFTGSSCTLPAIPVSGPVHVGLFAGDIHTTRPARLLAVRSATTDSGEERDPMPNGYAQAIKALDAKLDKNQGADNAGKALVVGDDGNVVPGKAQGGSSLPAMSSDTAGKALVNDGEKAEWGDAVRYDAKQSPTTSQKAQARENIGITPVVKTDDMTQSVGYDAETGELYTKPGEASAPVQSDWQQNDETAPDYVKNRPFYRMPGIVSFLDEATYYFTNDSDFYTYDFPSERDLVVGQTYTINWDGVEYECVCKQFNTFKYIGNLSITESSSENTGEPFLINNFGVYTQNTSASHVISITTQGYIYEKLPAEYIEDDAVSRVLLYNKPTITENQILAYQDDIDGGKIAAVSWGGEFFYSLNSSIIDNTYVLYADSLDGLTLFFDGSLNDSGEITYDLTSATFKGWICGHGRVDAPTFLVSPDTQRAMVRPYRNYVGSGTDAVIFEVKSDGSKGKGFQVLGTGAICTPFVILHSITPGSTKKFRITVDDSGTLSAAVVTDAS